MAESGEQKFNHLAGEKSPYLLQHARNPVDWYPWNNEALQKAAREDKPIFLSIGYAACHWCHVMAHESFEDPEVARILNESFVSIKVDREERPDLDQVYMSVCQALTGRGGWPLTIFMTPQANPFFAGTYFPKTGRRGMTGFLDLLKKISEIWNTDRESLRENSEEIRRAIGGEGRLVAGPAIDPPGVLEKAYHQLQNAFDETWGGFGAAPKFPTPHHLTFLLRWFRRSGDPQPRMMVEKTLENMRRGGIFDQLGFGFHRYSVDERWLVPHFEKMLYDQALLLMAYSEAYQALGKREYEETGREIIQYLLRDMTSPEGPFYSAEDADSEGREGRFYVWTAEEIRGILGREKAELFSRFYGVLPEGNFEEGSSVLHMDECCEEFAGRVKIAPEELRKVLEEGREKLFQERQKRVHPLKDDKILTAWNGLAIAALAKASQAFQDSAFSQAACRATDFILEKMKTPQGGLYRRYRDQETAVPGFLDDYAFLIWGLIELYEATFRITYLKEAVGLQKIMLELFWDPQEGGFYFTGRGHEELIARPKEIYDGAVPSGNSAAALNLLRLARMTGETEWEEKAARMITAFSAEISRAPMAYTQFLVFLDFLLGPGQEIVICGDPAEKEVRAMAALIRRGFHPGKVLLFRAAGQSGEDLPAIAPFTAEMQPLGGKATVYLCRDYSCRTPITDLAALQEALG